MEQDQRADNLKYAGQRLRQMRESNGLGLRTMARQIGGDPSSLSKQEKGKLPITPHIIDSYVRLCEPDERQAAVNIDALEMLCGRRPPSLADEDIDTFVAIFHVIKNYKLSRRTSNLENESEQPPAVEDNPDDEQIVGKSALERTNEGLLNGAVSAMQQGNWQRALENLTQIELSLEPTILELKKQTEQLEKVRRLKNAAQELVNRSRTSRI